MMRDNVSWLHRRLALVQPRRERPRASRWAVCLQGIAMKATISQKHSTKRSNYERCNVREARQYWDISRDASAGLTCVGNGVWLSAECRLRGLLD